MFHISFSISYLQLYLLIVSLISFFMYGYDKIISISKHTNRISEIKLLLSTFIGGSIGSLLAMGFFRHKIKKASFMIKFFLVVVVQVVIIYAYIKGYIPHHINF